MRYSYLLLVAVSVACSKPPPSANPAPVASEADPLPVEDEPKASAWDLDCQARDDAGRETAPFDVPCPGAVDYRLTTVVEGRECELVKANDTVVGGLCFVANDTGEPLPLAKVSCSTGCVCSAGASVCEAVRDSAEK